MREEYNMEALRERFVKMCPDVINAVQDLITNPETPVPAKVQLIGMVLDRAMGKPEASVKVSTNEESFEEAEARLMELVREIQIEEGMISPDSEDEENEGSDY